MKGIRFAGWALILSALLGILGWAGQLLNVPMNTFVVAISLIGSILFLVGLPGIQAAQPRAGWLGKIGLALMAVGALIAIGVTLAVRLGNASVGDSLPITSAVAGFLGDLLVGWTTVQARVFRPWIGWLLVLGGLLNLSPLLLPQLAEILSPIGQIAQFAALLGYGVTMVQKETVLA